MITHLDRNKLDGEKRALTDEAAEESRLANINGKKLQSIIDFIQEKHDECIEILREGKEEDIDVIIKAYRGLVRKLLKP